MSEPIIEAVRLARRLAGTDLPVILAGATGTGKELFAEEIHRWSGARGSFVDVNCAALPREMVEALLFGHRRGAFTGAVENAAGLLEEADGGTLFLDEMLCMPLEAQAKLLRALEAGEIRRVGETRKRVVRFRVIGAIQEDTSYDFAGGNLRADLLHRVAGVVIELPPLRERGNDVLILATHFAERRGRSLGRGTADVLLAHTWPGNIRELKLTIDRVVALSEEVVVTAKWLATSIDLGVVRLAAHTQPDVPAPALAPASPRERLLATFAANNWNAGRTARALGLGRTTLFKRLKALGISLREERASLDSRVQVTASWLRPRAAASGQVPIRSAQY
ncbi:MAG: sigma 54-interacting transcriptional regulator [Gemmatimonadales bacterium]